MEPTFKNLYKNIIVYRNLPDIEPYTYYRSRNKKRVFLECDIAMQDVYSPTEGKHAPALVVLYNEWGKGRRIFKTTPLLQWAHMVKDGRLVEFHPRPLEYLFT